LPLDGRVLLGGTVRGSVLPVAAQVIALSYCFPCVAAIRSRRFVARAYTFNVNAYRIA